MPVPIVVIVAGAVIGGATAAYLARRGNEKAPREKATRATPRPLASRALRANFKQLRSVLEAADGPKLAFLGGPGIGKSTLIVIWSHDAVRPRPKVGSETDATDWSTERGVPVSATWRGTAAHDLTIVDFPGFGTRRHPHPYFSAAVPFGLFDGVVFLVGGKIRKADEEVFASLRRKVSDDRILVVRTKLDAVPDDAREEVRADVAERLRWTGDVILTSSRTEEGFDLLRERIAVWTRAT